MSSYYDEIAADYDLQMTRIPGDTWAREAFQDFVIRGLAPGAVLLDFGCGTGLDTTVYAARGFHVVGYDSSPAMAREAACRCRDDIERRVVEVFSAPYEEFLGRPWTIGPPSAIAANFAVLNLVPSLARRSHGFTSSSRGGAASS